jgi:hypothetical protein
MLLTTELDSKATPASGYPGGDEELIAVAQHPGRKHPVGTQAHWQCVEESDSASEASRREASCKDEETTKLYR